MTSNARRGLAVVALAIHGFLYPFLIWTSAHQELGPLHLTLGSVMLLGAAALASGGRRRYWLAVLAATTLLLLGVSAAIDGSTMWAAVYAASTLPPAVLVVMCRPSAAEPTPTGERRPSRVRRFFRAFTGVVLAAGDIDVPEDRRFRQGCLPLLVIAASFVCLVLAPPILFIEKQLAWGLVLLAVGIIPPTVMFTSAYRRHRAQAQRAAESMPQVERDVRPDDGAGR